MRGIALVPVATVAAMALLIPIASSSNVLAQSAPIASAVVATEELAAGPADRRWAIRQDHELNKEHTHPGGFMYLQRGNSGLLIEGETLNFREGEGIWVPEGVPHTHRAEAGTQILSVTLETEAQAAAGPSLMVSGSLAAVGSGPYLARMTADQYLVGASTPLHRHFGPEVVFVRDGTYELASGGTANQYAGGQGYTMEPQLPHRLRNAGQEAAHLFNVSLVPLGRQTGETVALDSPGYTGPIAFR